MQPYRVDLSIVVRVSLQMLVLSVSTPLRQIGLHFIPSLHFLLETSNSPLNHFLLMNEYPFPSFEWDLGKEKRNRSSSACRVYVEVLIASSLAVVFKF